MRIERVNENKIKITFSNDDLLERNIEISNLNYNSREAQELFLDIMKKAESEFGFSTSDAQLSIEAAPDSVECFVITITRIEDDVDEAFESIQKYIRNKYKRSDLKAKKRARKVCSPIVIYFFTSMEDLKSLAIRLSKNYAGESTLYRYAGGYYLILTKSGWNLPATLESVVQEYGKRVLYISFYEGLLEEYGKKIAEQNAIDIIINFY
jgi:adapter protein MecA 1/2